MIRAAAIWLVLGAPMVQAQMLDFPANATLQTASAAALDSYDVPIGIWADGMLPVTSAEGVLTREAWRIDAPVLTTLQLLRPLREQLREDGFRIIFECQTEACGGFDFRFATDVLPPPEMQVNLGDFRFVTAVRDTADGPDFVTLLVSRSARAGFVQVSRIGPAPPQPAAVSRATQLAAPTAPAAPDDLARQLDDRGRAILPDLVFDTGSANLAEQDYPALAELAAYLQGAPDRNVALVGHTDSTGPLDPNIALSKRRAGAVLERLVTDYGVPRSQLAAEGMGYLAPLASNLTPQGREANRRVEVIITATR